MYTTNRGGSERSARGIAGAKLEGWSAWYSSRVHGEQGLKRLGGTGAFSRLEGCKSGGQVGKLASQLNVAERVAGSGVSTERLLDGQQLEEDLAERIQVGGRCLAWSVGLDGSRDWAHSLRVENGIVGVMIEQTTQLGRNEHEIKVGRLRQRRRYGGERHELGDLERIDEDGARIDG